MKRNDLLKFSSFLIVLPLVLSFFCAAFFADTGLEKLFEIPTASTGGWISGGQTVASSETIRNGDRASISFTSSSDRIEGEYRFVNEGTLFGKDSTSHVLLIRLFISDISALQGEKGSISFLCDDGTGIFWSVADIDIKSGWNDISLNFRTAQTLIPEKTIAEESENTESEEDSDAENAEDTAAETETGSEDEAVHEKTADEIFTQLTRFSFSFEKSPSKDTTIAFAEVSVNTHEKQKEQEPPEPITDKIGTAEIIISLVLAAGVTTAVIVFSAIYAKKEIRRRKREAKKRKAEMQNEESPSSY
jgi:hypothetical protein